MELRRWMPVVLALCFLGCSAPPVRHTESVATAEPNEAEYIIGPGDTIKVFVLGNPDLSTEAPVRPDGKISTPLVNDVVAVG